MVTLALLVTVLYSLLGSEATSITTRFRHDEICSIDEESFASEYSTIVEDMSIFDPQTMQSCSLFSLQDVSYNSFMAGEDDYYYDVCQTLFNFSQRLLVGLNATSQCCLYNSSRCGGQNDTQVKPISKAKAYGLGTVMVVALSLLSLLGVIIVPLMKRNKRCGHVYEHVNLFLIALGMSALLSDAVLHLIPRVFEQVLEEHLEAVDEFGEGREEEEVKGLALAILWRVCAVMAGLYIFYLFESILNSLTTCTKQEMNEGLSQSLIGKDTKISFGRSSPVEEHETKYHSKYGSLKRNLKQLKCRCKCDVKPLAVLIIVGDAFHNFTDGLALGASISQSLGLGVGTVVALAFHEIPHELGDYAVLLSTGMSWYMALLFNFLSSLTALAGFFIGVSVGLASQQANGWMLAVAAGTFLYISLVDLLPLLRSSKLKGFLPVLLTHLGFFVSFATLLLVAIYEEKFDTLVHIN